MENNTENFRQPLFNHLSNEHDLTLLDSELDEIISIASKIADEKRNQEIQKKYGIELINKEMWVWDDDVLKSELCFVLAKDNGTQMPYLCYDSDYDHVYFSNISETGPRIKQEPYIGDKGYFWDKEDYIYVYAKIHHIDKEQEDPYCSDIPGLMPFKYFSPIKQPWMK